MTPFTALKNFSPFHFISLYVYLLLFYFIYFFHFSYQPFTSLYFAIPIYNSHPFTSFAFTSPTVLHFPNPRFENMSFTVGSPDRPFRQLIPVSNEPIHKGVFPYVCSLFSGSDFPMMIDPTQVAWRL